jgi:hypothetical protein
MVDHAVRLRMHGRDSSECETTRQDLKVTYGEHDQRGLLT